MITFNMDLDGKSSVQLNIEHRIKQVQQNADLSLSSMVNLLMIYTDDTSEEVTCSWAGAIKYMYARSKKNLAYAKVITLNGFSAFVLANGDFTLQGNINMCKFRNSAVSLSLPYKAELTLSKGRLHSYTKPAVVFTRKILFSSDLRDYAVREELPRIRGFRKNEAASHCVVQPHITEFDVHKFFPDAPASMKDIPWFNQVDVIGEMWFTHGVHYRDHNEWNPQPVGNVRTVPNIVHNVDTVPNIVHNADIGLEIAWWVPCVDPIAISWNFGKLERLLTFEWRLKEKVWTNFVPSSSGYTLRELSWPSIHDFRLMLPRRLKFETVDVSRKGIDAVMSSKKAELDVDLASHILNLR
jgi:hypothetical protein